MNKNQSFLFFFLVLLLVTLLLMTVTGPKHWADMNGSQAKAGIAHKSNHHNGLAPIMFPEILVKHAHRYPGMEASDVYKLIYQGTMGPGHFNASSDVYLSFLRKEVERLREEPAWEGDTILVESIGDRFVRIHLRPYLEQGGTLEALTEAYERSLQVPADTGLFFRRMSRLTHTEGIMDTVLPSIDDLAVFMEQVSDGYNPPPVHHSDIFKANYHPHYRVLSSSEAEHLLSLLKDIKDKQ